MRVLTVDIGTGTQDIFFYDSELDIENGYKLVLPSPTLMVHRRIRAATRAGAPVLLSGTTMGGGPSAWAAEEHVRAGLPVYATPEAARSFNDDLNAVEATGIRVVGEDEARKLAAAGGVQEVELCDFDYRAIVETFERFGVPMRRLDAAAVAVFDHGNAPPGFSDRQFRFDYLDARIRAENRLSAFAYRAEEIPASMTRLLAVRRSAQGLDAPLVVMDTAPAAVLGATLDLQVAQRERKIITNVGNFHTLAFRLGAAGIEGVFEHHTGLLDRDKLERLLRALAQGTLRHEEVFAGHGHGALIYKGDPLQLPKDDYGVVVTGPRRNMLLDSGLRPYFPAPFGDMMIAGCFGLLAAAADCLPQIAGPVRASLARRDGKPPWEGE